MNRNDERPAAPATWLGRARSAVTGLALVVAAAALGLTANYAYTRLTADSCCYPGSPCCVPGSPCCANHHVATR
jgi:hypothetical protein